jgi:hypothetical protein
VAGRAFDSTAEEIPLSIPRNLVFSGPTSLEGNRDRG